MSIEPEAASSLKFLEFLIKVLKTLIRPLKILKILIKPQKSELHY